MSNFENLSDVMTGHNPHQELLKQTRKLVDKWEPTGLLDDIGDSTKKTGMAILLENQATQLIKLFLLPSRKLTKNLNYFFWIHKLYPDTPNHNRRLKSRNLNSNLQVCCMYNLKLSTRNQYISDLFIILLFILLSFFSTEDRIHCLKSNKLKNLLEAVLFEPGIYSVDSTYLFNMIPCTWNIAKYSPVLGSPNTF